MNGGDVVEFGNELEKTGGKLGGTTTLADNSTINVGRGDFTFDNIQGNENATINVGNHGNAGNLTIGQKSELKGAGLFLDPAWKNDGTDTIEYASHAILEGTNIDGKLTAGQNSLLVLGDTSADWAMNAFEESEQNWGQNDITAAVAIVTAQTMTGTGSLLANGELTTAIFADNYGDANFTKQSLLLVKGDVAAGNTAALTGIGTGSLSVAKGAKLYISDAEANKTYTITDKFKVTDDSGDSTVLGWTGEDLILNRKAKGEVSIDEATGKVTVETSTADISQQYSGLDAVNAYNTVVSEVSSENMGQRFLSRAIDPTYLAEGDFVAASNEVASASVTAGVQNTALRLADAASENVLNHLSLSNFDSGNSIHADGTDFWATPMYGNTYTSGMSASGASVRGNYGGIAFGADTQVGEVLGGKVRVGAALNGGGGKSETKGTVTTTQNDYNFGGINLYAGWNKGNLNVIAGLGYGIGDNEVEMGLPASMKMGTAKADVDTSVITADLRAEYQLKTNWLDILPHAGVRYTALRTDSHDLKVNGSVLNSVDAETQHIVQFPVGVTLTKNIDAWGWNVKPQVDVSVIPAAGDKDMNTKVRFSGVDAVDSIDTRIMDSTSWSGMVGVQASKGNLSFGLNYGIQASSHETDQRVQASIGWKF